MLVNKLQAHFSAGELAPILRGRVDIDKYTSSCRSIMNYLVLPFGALTHRPGFKYIASAPSHSAADKVRLIPFEFSNEDTYIIEFSDLKIRFYRNQGIVVSGMSAYEVVSPYTKDDLDDLRFTQSFDTVYITHGSYAPRKLVRVTNTNWSLSIIDFDEPAWGDINATTTTLTFSATSGTGVTCTASSATFTSTDVGRAIRFRAGPENTELVQYTGTGSQTNFDIPFFPQTSNDVDVYSIAASGARTQLTYNATPGAGQFNVSGGQVIVGGTALTTSEKLQIQRKNAGSGVWGWAEITGYTSTTSVTVSIISQLGGTNASADWRLGAWSDTTGYPKLCTFHEQRLWFANTSAEPRGLWGSATGDFENFAPDNANKKGDIDPDTSVSFQLNTAAINWIRGVKALLIGCVDGLIQVSGGGSPITATTVNTKKDSSLPTEFAEIAATSDEVIFLERLGKKVHSIRYSFSADGFETSELTTLAVHMAQGSKFKYIAYANTPNSIVWVMREDGGLRSCTYVAAQNTVGWANHTIAGEDVEIESIATIAGSTYTELWAVIKRTINGSTKRYIECMQATFDGGDVQDSFFVDSGLTYSGSATSTLSGLSHLEGESVTIIAEGATHPNRTVSSGSITLDYEVTKAVVGLYSEAHIESNYIESGSQIGTNQGMIAAIHTAIIRFHETVGGEVGFDSSSTSILPFRIANDPMDTAVTPFSGDKRITFPHGFDRGYKIYVNQPYALPSTVLMIVYQANVSNK